MVDPHQMIYLFVFFWASLLWTSEQSVGQENSTNQTICPTLEIHTRMVRLASDYLRRQGQARDGSFSSSLGPGVTSIVAASLLRTGHSPEDPMVAKSLEYLQHFAREDGGIYQVGSRYRNYETCLAILCFKEANQDGRHDELLRQADRFVRKLQWDDGQGGSDHISHGGAGYGKNRRPDLSNTAFLVDAIKAAGKDPQDDSLQKALVFISRCQNFPSTYNTTKYSGKNPDGGFYYTPAAGGFSQAGLTATGGLRSYGSMTYAGLKSMIYAGLGPDDKRVQAALRWIASHYTLRENPGLAQAGLYYYYHTFSKALDAVGKDLLIDSKGTAHDWRRELTLELSRRQQPDGSWINTNSRWLEGDPNLVTGYVLLTLSHCQPGP